MRKTVTTRPYQQQVGVWEYDVAIYWKPHTIPVREKHKSNSKTEKGALADGYEYVALLEELVREEIKLYGRPFTSTERNAHNKAQAAVVKAAASPPKKACTFSVFVPRYLERVLLARGDTQSTYDLRDAQIRLHLMPLFKDTRLSEIGTEAFGRLAASLRKTRAGTMRGAKEINEVMGLLYNILVAAKRFGEIETLPERPESQTVQLPDIEIYTESEFERLVAAGPLVCWQANLAVLLAGDAGLRLGEIVGLERGDLDLVEGYVFIRQQETPRKEVTKPKHKKTRRVKLTDRLRAALKAAPSFAKRVLLTKKGNPCNRTSVWYWLKAVERAAGLTVSYSPHTLRHTFATRLVRRGVNPRAIQKLLGHSRLETTLRYCHLEQGEADRAIEGLVGNILETKR